MSEPDSQLIILGAGGHGRVVADAAQASGLWRDIVFLDDRFPALRTAGPWPVIGAFSALAALDPRCADVAMGIGDNDARLHHVERLRAAGWVFPTVIHPAAAISPHAIIGAASVVFAGAVVNIGALIGVACIINSGSVIEHDCAIADGVHLSPRAALAGTVTLGRCSWIGIGASVIQGIRIGRNVRVGAGASVVRDLPDGVTASGVPARIHEVSSATLPQPD